MPKCLWLLLGAALGLLHSLNATDEAADALGGAIHYFTTRPAGLAFIASLALWHLSTHLPKALRRATHR